jgi:type IV secretion system protein VirD4
VIARLMLILGLGALAFAAIFAATVLNPPPWLLALLVVFVVLAAYRKVIPGVHGTSRWANGRDLAPLMASSRGLLLGRAFTRPLLASAIRLLFRAPWRDSIGACRVFFATLRSKKTPGELVRLPDVVHTSLFAPTGVGKSTGVLIPHLLICEDSCVVVDPKGELALATARHRRKVFGDKCVFLDPFRQYTTKPDCLNPLDFIERDDPGLIDACRVLAESMIIRTGNEKDPTWNDSAENVIRTICCYVAQYAPDNDRSLQTCRAIIADAQTEEASGRKGLFHLALDAMQHSTAFDGLFARMGMQLKHYRDKELASVLTTVNRFLSFLDSPAVQLSTERSTFDPRELKRGKMTVYLILPPFHLRAQSSLLRLWLTCLMHETVKEAS